MLPKPPNLTTLLTTLHNSLSPNLNQVAQIHAQLITTNHVSNPLLLTQLINLYAKSACLADALRAFDSAQQHTNVVTWTSLIARFSHSRRPFVALSLFSRLLREPGLRPNPHTFSAVLKACAATGSAANGLQVHTLAFKLGVSDGVYVASASVDMYAKCGEMDAAQKMFDEMPVRNLVSWNALIVGCLHNKLYDKALEAFKQLIREKFLSPDEVSFSSVLSACANGGSLVFGRQLHGRVVKLAMESLHYVKNSLIDMYTKCGCFQEAVELFSSSSCKDVVAWNIMMMGWVQTDHFEEACRCFQTMLRDEILLDEASFSTVLNALAGLASWGQGASVHTLITKSGFTNNLCVGSSLVTMYAKCGSLEDAYQAFEDTKRYVSVVSWTAMITAFQQHGHGDRVIELFEQMLQEDIMPDYITFVSVLSACGHNGLIDQGFRYFNYMSQVHNMRPSHEHYACMVDMLGRAGRLDEAKEFVDTMPVKPGPSVWGALLGACRNYGNLELGKEVAQKLFEIEPDKPGNYVLLCNMYASSGMLEEAKEVRKLMGSYGVKKETGCSWIDVRNKTHVFMVHDRSHHKTEEIYGMLKKLEKLVKEKGYVPDSRFAMNDVGEQKEQRLWYHSERLALAFALISLPVDAPIRIKKNLRTCGDCHTVMKLVSGILKRDIILRDTNRFHRFADGSCSCKDYW